MDGYRTRLLLLVVVGLTGLSGASCPSTLQPFWNWNAPPPAPPVLPTTATLEQVIQVVNQNNSRIHSYSSDRATLSSPGMPSLRANLAFERPRRFRLRAETGITGPELDLGSNDQYFWFWIKRNQPPAVYFCRHDQFDASRAKQLLPIDPNLLIEALGTAELDPALPHQGPFFSPSGDRVEVRTVRETADGPVTKVTVVDARRGWVVEQRVFDARGQMVARSVTKRHRRDPLSNLVMPSLVEITCPLAQFSMEIDLGPVRINRPLGNPAELWTMPDYPGYPVVDLGNPDGPLSPATRPMAVSSRPGRPLEQGWRAAGMNYER